MATIFNPNSTEADIRISLPLACIGCDAAITALREHPFIVSMNSLMHNNYGAVRLETALFNLLCHDCRGVLDAFRYLCKAKKEEKENG